MSSPWNDWGAWACKGAGGLTEEQKQALAAIDRETGAKVAEQEILLKSRIQTALATGDVEGATKLREEMKTSSTGSANAGRSERKKSAGKAADNRGTLRGDFPR